MKQLSLFVLGATTFLSTNATSQSTPLEFNAVKAYGHLLEDVMEITDTNLLITKLAITEANYNRTPNERNAIRLGIIYHEVALNFAFFTSTQYKGYAEKSFNLLSKIIDDTLTTPAALPYASAYQASALSLMSAETKNLSLLKTAFELFEKAVIQYGALCYLPEFLRGSVAENLPKVFFRKRQFAKQDSESIIKKQSQNPDYANWKIMSFTYWAWANQHQSKRYRKQAIEYLDKAIELDPHNKAARHKSEILKRKLSRT